jgi:septal ring factor EnvC (AmiA/AmiB activator)
MTTAEIATGLFQVVVAVLALTSGLYAARVARAGKARELEQQQAAAREAAAAEDRRQRFAELQSSLEAKRADLQWYSDQLTATRTLLGETGAKIADLERRLVEIERDKDAAYEQADALAEQLNEERESNKLLRSQLAATLAELEGVKQQNVILAEHAARIDDWWHLLLRTNGHPEGVAAPPVLSLFQKPKEPNPSE